MNIKSYIYIDFINLLYFIILYLNLFPTISTLSFYNPISASLSNGNILECEFRNDKPNGYGIFYFNNGDKYEGKFKDGTNYGYGIFYSSLGFKYENYFKNGIYEKFLFNIYKIILFFHKIIE